MRNLRVLFILCLSLLAGSSWADPSLLIVSGKAVLADGHPAGNMSIRVENLTLTGLGPVVVTSDGQGSYRAIFLATDNIVGGFLLVSIFGVR